MVYISKPSIRVINYEGEKNKLCVPEINNNGDNAHFHCPKLDLSGLGTQSLPS